MIDTIENIKSRLLRKVEELFYGHVVDFAIDPDDTMVHYVRVYDVAKEDVKKAKDQIWNVIESFGLCDDIVFIPYVVRHEDVEKLYPTKSAFRVNIAEDDGFDMSLFCKFFGFKKCVLIPHNKDDDNEEVRLAA